MNIEKALHELHEEKDRLDRAIARLEGTIREAASGRRSSRGRKSMPAEERLQVSRRMAEYWAARRQMKAEEV